MRKFLKNRISSFVNKVFSQHEHEKETHILSMLNTAPAGYLEEDAIWYARHSILALIALEDILTKLEKNGWVEKTVSAIGKKVSYAITPAGVTELHRRRTA